MRRPIVVKSKVREMGSTKHVELKGKGVMGSAEFARR